MRKNEFQDKNFDELMDKVFDDKDCELKEYVFKAVHEKDVVIYYVSARSESEAIEKVKYNLIDDAEVVCMTDLMDDMSIVSKEEMDSATPVIEGDSPKELLDNADSVHQYILRTIEDRTSYYTVDAFNEEDAWDTVYRNFKEGSCLRQAILEGPEVITEDEMHDEFEHEGKFSRKLLGEVKES